MNAFQKFLSYLFPVLIERRTGELSHDLSVYLHRGKLKLYSEETNYSFGQLHVVFQKALRNFKYQETNTSKILILGFGAGSIASILRNEMHIDVPIVGVEKDATVIRLYEKYFSPALFSVYVIEEDALSYVKNYSELFDLILVDIFIDRTVPSFCYEQEFIVNLNRILTKSGTVVFNTITSTLTEEVFEKSIHKHFTIKNKNRIFRQNCVYFLMKKLNR